MPLSVTAAQRRSEDRRLDFRYRFRVGLFVAFALLALAGLSFHFQAAVSEPEQVVSALDDVAVVRQRVE